MVDIRPFKAIRYTEQAGNPETLITQPYDKIDAKMQQKYYEQSPYNYCRLVLPTEPNRYEVVHQRIQKWLSENVMAKEAQSAFFVIRQEYTLDGKTCARTGMIAAVRLCSYEEKEIFPHEITFSGPKLDRLNMLRTIQKDLEPVFFIYSDPEKATVNLFEEITKTKPIFQVVDAFNVTHSIWMINSPEKVAFLQEAMAQKKLVIADGHHRYESAVAYRNEMRQKGFTDADYAFNFHIGLIVPVEDEGLIILPTHRLLTKTVLTDEMLTQISKFFVVSEVEHTVTGLEAFLQSHSNEHAFCIYTKTKAYGLLLKHKESVYEFVNAKTSKETKLFDVVILRDVVFKAIMKTGELNIDQDILFVRWTKAAVEKVDNGEAEVAFLVNPIMPQTVWEIAQMHERLPEKSTDFYPKMVSGLMMMDISSKDKL
ncbi:MAG: DUF1015 domain-containing protein [Candidatus Bathyarchaeota archaeon]|nr:DUF1015 domain-containing protein [Candidatus Bathyarchaeota archaeon]